MLLSVNVDTCHCAGRKRCNKFFNLRICDIFIVHVVELLLFGSNSFFSSPCASFTRSQFHRVRSFSILRSFLSIFIASTLSRSPSLWSSLGYVCSILLLDGYKCSRCIRFQHLIGGFVAVVVVFVISFPFLRYKNIDQHARTLALVVIVT